MTTELTILTLAALLQILQFCAYSFTANQQVSRKVAFGPRDTAVELTGTAGRLKRALNNHFEGLSPWRSLIWAVGLLATVAMLIAALV